MDLELGGRCALVTAASKGLGRATATVLAAEGARVVVSSRDADRLAATAAEIAEQTGAEVHAVPADVSKADDLRHLVAETERLLGGVDVLVNNAGGPRAGGFDDLDDDAWQEAFELLLLSSVRLVRGVLPSMRARGGGRIVTVASSSIKQPIGGLLLSNTYRVALVGLTKSLATELGPDGVLVNALGPGRIDTDRVAGLDAGRAQATGASVDEVRAANARSIPLGRYGTPEEFGRAAAWLVSGANTYLTGQAFLVDGGMVSAI